MRLTFAICLGVLAALLLYLSADFGRVVAWAVDMQRAFQNQMADAVRALRAGEPDAYFALLGATLAYGFVHALGPGHGKFLVGGVGVGTKVSVAQLVTLAVASSLLQALWAIVLVYGGFMLFEATAHSMTDLAEEILAPASYIAIACIGLALVWRGVRSLRRSPQSVGETTVSECGCHSHGPTPDEIAKLNSAREGLALVLSIAIRPCTGAIFLLVIAWQMDLRAAGGIAVVAMGVGTAALTSLVALSSVAARTATLASTSYLSAVHVAFPILQVSVGTLIALISLGLLGLIV